MTAIFEGLDVLIAEDDFIIASDLEGIFHSHGARVTMTASMDVLGPDEKPRWDLALVDRHLTDGDSLPLVKRLLAAGVAVVMQTGDDRMQDHAALSERLEVVMKPSTEADIVASCQRALAKR